MKSKSTAIPFSQWREHIGIYCQFVLDDGSMDKAWIKRDFSDTSVTDFNELYEQAFDFIHSYEPEEARDEIEPDDTFTEERYRAAVDFLHALNKVDFHFSPATASEDHRRLFTTAEWAAVKTAARKMLAA